MGQKCQINLGQKCQINMGQKCQMRHFGDFQTICTTPKIDWWGVFLVTKTKNLGKARRMWSA